MGRVRRRSVKISPIEAKLSLQMIEDVFGENLYFPLKQKHQCINKLLLCTYLCNCCVHCCPLSIVFHEELDLVLIVSLLSNVLTAAENKSGERKDVALSDVIRLYKRTAGESRFAACVELSRKVIVTLGTESFSCTGLLPFTLLRSRVLRFVYWQYESIHLYQWGLC